ncbi:MAG: NAD(P)H-hydrate dehydratase [Patescibacteria group bacterium]|nr:NAD(P)H-hydrate dehydratase [Patescibacteria group bacterium]
MIRFDETELKNLYIPSATSHKGQNGKLLIIGGSTLFHAASLWALTIASRIVDMVFYASVPENAAIIHEAKKEFRNGIVIPREHIEDYIEEADAVLIGPGMMRADGIQNSEFKIQNLAQLERIKDEGAQTYLITQYLLHKYPHKKWVIDAGALQMMDQKWLLEVGKTAILTPHPQEFHRLFHLEAIPEHVASMANMYMTTILLKGQTDIVARGSQSVAVSGGSAGMTKGGTGDVLAGLTAALYTKNEAFLSAKAASFFNKKAGESLFERLGLYFNSSDLALEIPAVMKKYLL